MEPPRRPLALGFVALGVLAAVALGPLPPARRGLARWGLLLGLPLVVGALGQLFGPTHRHLPHPAEVRVPRLRRLPLVLALVALDFSPLAAGWALGWISFAPGEAPLTATRWLVLLLAFPVIGFVSTVGWEWGLRARLAGPWIAVGHPRRALLASAVAGAALTLPVVAPGLRVLDGAFLASGLACALLREAVAVRLFRRRGVLLSGAWRTFVVSIEALVVADALSFWLPSVGYAASVPAFHALRVAGPLAAALLAWGFLGRLDRLDAERRRHP